MGGGGGFLGDVVKVATNPVGEITKRVTGSSGLGAAVDPIGALVGRGVNRVTGGAGKSGGDGMVSTMPFGGGGEYDEFGRPILKDFNSQLTSTGALKDVYQMQNTLDKRGLQAVRDEALRAPGGMSKWGQMALSQAQNQNALAAAGQRQQAQNQLAMQGGLRSGARERLAAQGMQQQLKGTQGALGNIQMQDEQNRQKWLGMLPGQELASAQYESTIQDRNIGRSLDELRKGRDYDKYRYGQAMNAWGADKSSDAMRRAAEEAKSTSGLFGGGGFLGLGF
jgi:hypothetical protein